MVQKGQDASDGRGCDGSNIVIVVVVDGWYVSAGCLYYADGRSCKDKKEKET